MSVSLIKAINRTIEYGAEYGVMYPADEIKKRLISEKIYKDEEIDKVLKSLPINQEKSGDYQIQSKYKIIKAKKLSKLIQKYFNDILMMGITGSVAAGYPKESDDIDLIIVTKKNKLWLTRLKLRLFILFNKIPHRKYGQKEKPDEFCFNLWLDEETLCLPVNKRSLGNAMDLVLVKPLINKGSIYQKFVSENGWVKKYVANGYSEIIKNCQLDITNKKRNINYWDKITNWVVFWPQYWYMKSKIKSGLIDTKRAFFHPNTNR